jgi:Protein of unknown function (DUF3224)
MKNRSRCGIIALAAGCLFFGSGAWTLNSSQAQAPDKVQKGASLSNHASGAFDVKGVPAAPEDKAEGTTLGRMTLDKQFHGDLEATSKGEMLYAGTSVKGSAGYVAIERVSGTLHGRTGTFILQHTGTMTRGVPELSVTVVPDSGTGQLTGLAGKMTINIADGKHSYDFDYTLPPTP